MKEKWKVERGGGCMAKGSAEERTWDDDWRAFRKWNVVDHAVQNASDAT
jgi:hypothetical protein